MSTTLRRLFRTSGPIGRAPERGRRRPSRRGALPGAEARLEDRLLLATFTVTNTLDDGRPRVLYLYRTEPVMVVHKPGDDPREVSISASWDDAGRLLYRLIVHGVEVPGRCIVDDRAFRPER